MFFVDSSLFLFTYYLRSTAIYIKKKKKCKATGSVPNFIQRNQNESSVKEILLEISKRMHDREHSTLQRHSANTKEKPPGSNGDLQFDKRLRLEFCDPSLKFIPSSDLPPAAGEEFFKSSGENGVGE